MFGHRKRRQIAPSQSENHATRDISRDSNLEAAIQRIGTELLEDAQRHRRGLLSAAMWQDKLMTWAMKDEAFKVSLFRFVDVFPTLDSAESIHEVLTDYLSQPEVTLPPGMGISMKAGGVLKGAFAGTMTRQITGMARQFIAGANATEALPALKKLRQDGLAFSVDLLGEVCVSDREADAYQARYLELVNALATTVSTWPANDTLDRDHRDAMPRANVSVKISSLSARINVADPEQSIDDLIRRLEPILLAAAKQEVLINFDMEHHAFKDLTLALFRRCCETYDFPAGIALQAYLRSGDQDARALIDWAQRANRHVWVRLIKGAYWDHETIHAEEQGWPVPVWSRKADTDACFERMADAFIDAAPEAPGAPGVSLALGTHNLRSIAAALARMKMRNLPDAAIEFQMLHGMGDELKAALREAGHRVRVYLPVGEMIPGMAYLVRRLLENTSNESWLRGSESGDADAAVLLASPHPSAGEALDATGLDSGVQVSGVQVSGVQVSGVQVSGVQVSGVQDPGIELIRKAAERHQLSAAIPGLGDGRAFVSTPLRDFSAKAQREAFAEAVGRSKVPAIAIDATASQAEAAVATARQAVPGWRDRPVIERARLLESIADRMAARRDEWSGTIIRESGKTWAEADADVCEAIDFLRFYARESVTLMEPSRLGVFVGEFNQRRVTPLGVAAVISPWNFPLAIVTGMSAAALVTGNPTIVKPAEQTPGVASLMADAFWDAGVPRDVLQFLPGAGETVGATLVNDPRVNLIAFTGSREVGLGILQRSGEIGPERRVVCEMGGKNAIIVDATADLDEAVLGVRHSAFAFAGQKCSACSRCIVVGGIHDAFVDRLVNATAALSTGDPLRPGTDLGPVIDFEAAAKIRRAIEHAGDTPGVQRAFTGSVSDSARESGIAMERFIPPHLLTGVTNDMPVAREEIFGPVLAVIHVATFDAALAVANDSIYRLTGGVYSRTPSHLDRARTEYRVGNLYLNRACTGALVGRQPFGGFGQSGTGTKAGGADYLRHFVNPIVVTENTARRGFAPGLV